MYQGITYIGTGRFAGLYGLNETIVDQKAIGLQHLFIDDYSIDLIHTACSVCIVDNKAYFGDRIKPKLGHALRFASSLSKVVNQGVFEDRFDYDGFQKIDRVTAFDRDYLYFESEITNLGKKELSVNVAALCITQNNSATKLEKQNDSFIISNGKKTFGIKVDGGQGFSASLDAPSGFMYHGIEDLLFNKNPYASSITADTSIACSIGKETFISPGQSILLKWIIVIDESPKDCCQKIDSFDFLNPIDRSIDYWGKWLSQNDIGSTSNYPEVSNNALIALKAANLAGFLPADLTGHYFANNKVCFYVRDSLMAARAFLYSGHFIEFEEIIHFLMGCPLKENGEFYQRYNAHQLPDEGANNSVFSQMDAIGYFARDVADFRKLSGKLTVEMKKIIKIVDVLFDLQKKNGLFGPEGGVNEGVYGPAYITSTNMFIAGGLEGIAKMAFEVGENDAGMRWKHLSEKLVQTIEQMFVSDGYYSYGYVDYHDEKIMRYDTPQFFGASLGYPITENYRKNYEFLKEHATFFGLGFGYSEQEYHNGPWMFNTSAAAQTAYFIGKMDDYKNIMNWIINHRNAYGLLPEAIDARDESRSFINPLMWANAEMVVACYVDAIVKTRGKCDE